MVVESWTFLREDRAPSLLGYDLLIFCMLSVLRCHIVFQSVISHYIFQNVEVPKHCDRLEANIFRFNDFKNIFA